MSVAAVLLDDVIDLVGARIARRAMRFVAVASVQISVERYASVGQRTVAYRRVQPIPETAPAVQLGSRLLSGLLGGQVRRVRNAGERDARQQDKCQSLHICPNAS